MADIFEYTSGSTPEDEPPEDELLEEKPPAAPAPVPGEPHPRRERGLRTLWTVGSILSIALNLFLCIILFVAGNQLFTLKKMIGVDMLGGLAVNLISLDQAHIKTTIEVQQNVPLAFDLPIDQNAQVTTIEPTYINGATIKNLTAGGLYISNATADLTLPSGTPMQVHINMVVPVRTTVPVNLTIPVDIPLQETDLHQPLQGLQQIAASNYWMLKPQWAGCQDVPLFSHFGPLCKLFFRGP
jgi:hypothetical protein